MKQNETVSYYLGGSWQINLPAGQFYTASRPMPIDGRTEFPVTIRNAGTDERVLRIEGFDLETADLIVTKFNQHPPMFYGRYASRLFEGVVDIGA
jgi:hypothetical protein